MACRPVAGAVESRCGRLKELASGECAWWVRGAAGTGRGEKVNRGSDVREEERELPS